MTSFRILGSIEAWSGERRLALGGPRQLTLLAFLILHANRAVPTDGIIDALWGSARSGSDNRLKMAIARLRKALAPLDTDAGPLLRTVSGGYLLAIGPQHVDADLFSRRVQEGIAALESGEPARAEKLVGEGLALWRGPALAEVAFEDFAQAEIRRLEELRLTAIETRLEAGLQLGEHRQLIGELESLHVEHPTRERLTAQLMIALYLSGRQADALEVYQRTRIELADELGLEPGPQLKSLQADILAQSPALETTSTQAAARRLSHPGARASRALSAPLANRLEPHGPAIFVDRSIERRTLTQLVEQAAATGLAAAFVTGEPGIGKTRLISEFAAHAHANGTLVLAGRCDEGLDLPYQPFVEALEHLVEHAPLQFLEEHVSQHGESLVRLVPALASRVTSTSTALLPASESERYVLFRAIEGLLSAACERGPVLLVLEDLHWADVPTLKLLRRLIASPKRLRLMLLSTCRVEGLAGDHPLRELLADVHREPRVVRLELRGLGTRDVLELVRGLSTGAVESSEQLISALEASTNGNPFFITELMRSLVETEALVNENGHWRLKAGTELESHLPVSITETLAQRVRRMGEDVWECLQVAAIVGDEFDLDLVAAVTENRRAVDALDRAVQAAILLEVPGRPARLRFVHALTQLCLYGELGAGRRTELHRRVALAMEARGDEARWSLAELARHWLAAGQAEAATALQYAVRAGDEALAKLAPDEARRWYGISVDLLSRQHGMREAELADLLIRRGEAERQAGDRRFRETLLEAAELAQRAADDGALIRAALANTRGMQSETGIVDQARVATLDAALRVVGAGDSPERARLLAMQAAELMYSPDWHRRVQLSDEALEIGRRLNDPETLSRVLNMRFVTLLAPQTLDERRANAAEAVDVAERLRDPLPRFFAYHWCGYASIEAGEVGGARSWAVREREIADRFRQPTTVWLSRADEANLAIIDGRLELAEELASRAFDVGRNSEPDAHACYVAQRTSIAFEARRLHELIPMLEQAVADNPGVPGFRAVLALALTERRGREEAQRILDRAAASNFEDLPRDVTWLSVVCIYAEVSARLECLAVSRVLYELLMPWQDQIAFPAFGVWGPVMLYLGVLALVLGEVEAAERHLAGAARVAARAGAPLWEARAAHELTRLAQPTR